MCPICMTTTLALVTATVTSTGGLSALIVSRIRRKRMRRSEGASQEEKSASPPKYSKE